jgi:hypothetical protein
MAAFIWILILVSFLKKTKYAILGYIPLQLWQFIILVGSENVFDIHDPEERLK